MLNSQKNGLQIFDEFVIDYNLKKHERPKDGNNMATGGFINPSAVTAMAWSDNPMPINIGSGGFDASISIAENQLNHQLEISKLFWKRLFKKLFGWMVPDPKPKLTVQQFFSEIKTKLEQPELYTERVNDYIKLAAEAKKNGQQALFEELSRDAKIVKEESKLLASGFCTCITEEQVVTFYKDSEKGLSLTYIRNFARVIPGDVCKKKEEADELLAFDNYVILHFDPQQKAFKLTQEQIHKKRDPILFGLISGTRKLYYIADWVDEYCDLTLKQFIDKFGEKAIEANNITVKYKKAVK